MPGGLRDLLRELFTEHLRDALGCSLDRGALDLDALDRVVVVAHSGGYQAAAGAIELGDVPRITEVDLLDALYGADDVFLHWIRTQRERFDPRVNDGLRFVDLYTCCAGTADASRALAASATAILQSAGLGGKVAFDGGEGALDRAVLTHPVVFRRVPEAHGELPRAHLRELIEAAGFAHIEGTTRTRYDRSEPQPGVLSLCHACCQASVKERAANRALAEAELLGRPRFVRRKSAARTNA